MMQGHLRATSAPWGSAVQDDPTQPRAGFACRGAWQLRCGEGTSRGDSAHLVRIWPNEDKWEGRRVKVEESLTMNMETQRGSGNKRSLQQQASGGLWGSVEQGPQGEMCKM